jgi:hypothetical protein
MLHCHRPNRPLPVSVLASVAAGGLTLWICAASSAQSSASPDPADPHGPVFAISEFVVEYGDATDGLPPVSELVPFDVELVRAAAGYAAPEPGDSAESVRIGTAEGTAAASTRGFHASAIAVISRALLARVQELGFVGVLVGPHPEDVEVRGERDLRPPGRSAMRLRVAIGRVQELRSVAVAGRVTDGWKINNPIHRELRRRSPIQPSGGLRPGTTDRIHKDVLEDYLFRLNRHPGRRVEAALASSEDGTGVALDFRVTEAKPWFAYFQSSDTGSARTDRWQQRVGYIHRQLTGRDDILSFQYTNAGGAALNAIQASYEAPWFGPERPGWWKSQPDEAQWQRWLRRDFWPWFGVDRLRWRISGSFTRFEADTIDIAESVRGQEWSVDGRLIYELFQHRNFFLDVYAGSRMLKVDVLNQAFNGSADEFFLIPELGIEAERIQETSTFRASVGFETNISNTNPDAIALLGRRNAEANWKALRSELGWSQYLEPLLFPEAWEDPSSASSSTLAHELSFGVRGQYAFGERLIPQVSQVLGGFFSVRGYEQSAAVGDSTVVGSLEYRFHLPHALPS